MSPLSNLSTATPVESIAPLSPGQQRYFSSEPLAAGVRRWPETWAARLEGSFDYDAMRRAVEAVVTRHAALRTTFRAGPGTHPVQVIAPPPAPPILLVDCPDPGERVTLRSLAPHAHIRPQHPTDSDLFRVTALRVARERHLLVVQLHHLLSDGWSYGVLLEELSDEYGAIVSGAPSPVAPLGQSFPEWCLDVEQRRRTGAYSAQLREWDRLLAEPISKPNLPTSAPRSGVLSRKVEDRESMIPAADVDRLERLSRSSPVAGGLGGALVATLALVLSQLSGTTDLRVGVLAANRRTVDSHRLIGFLANPVAVRVVLEPNESVTELVGKCNAALATAQDNQEVPIQDVLGHLMARRPSFDPHALYSAMLVLTPRRLGSFQLAGLDVVELDLREHGRRLAPTTIDLRWQFDRSESGLAGHVTHKHPLFGSRGMTGLVRHWERLASELIDRREDRVGDVLTRR